MDRDEEKATEKQTVGLDVGVWILQEVEIAQCFRLDHTSHGSQRHQHAHHQGGLLALMPSMCRQPIRAECGCKFETRYWRNPGGRRTFRMLTAAIVLSLLCEPRKNTCLWHKIAPEFMACIGAQEEYAKLCCKECQNALLCGDFT